MGYLVWKNVGAAIFHCANISKDSKIVQVLKSEIFIISSKLYILYKISLLGGGGEYHHSQIWVFWNRTFLNIKGLLYCYLVLKQESYVIEDLLHVEYTGCSKMANSILNSLSTW